MSVQLLNCKQLAEAIGRNPMYVSAMKRCGFVMRYAGRTTFKEALDWLAENPEFRMAQAYPKKTQPVPKPI